MNSLAHVPDYPQPRQRSKEGQHKKARPGFFVLTFFAALPGLWIVWHMRQTIHALDNPDGQ